MIIRWFRSQDDLPKGRRPRRFGLKCIANFVTSLSKKILLKWLQCIIVLPNYLQLVLVFTSSLLLVFITSLNSSSIYEFITNNLKTN